MVWLVLYGGPQQAFPWASASFFCFPTGTSLGLVTQTDTVSFSYPFFLRRMTSIRVQFGASDPKSDHQSPLYPIPAPAMPLVPCPGFILTDQRTVCGESGQTQEGTHLTRRTCLLSPWGYGLLKVLECTAVAKRQDGRTRSRRCIVFWNQFYLISFNTVQTLFLKAVKWQYYSQSTCAAQGYSHLSFPFWTLDKDSLWISNNFGP